MNTLLERMLVEADIFKPYGKGEMRRIRGEELGPTSFTVDGGQINKLSIHSGQYPRSIVGYINGPNFKKFYVPFELILQMMKKFEFQVKRKDRYNRLVSMVPKGVREAKDNVFKPYNRDEIEKIRGPKDIVLKGTDIQDVEFFGGFANWNKPVMKITDWDGNFYYLPIDELVDVVRFFDFKGHRKRTRYYLSDPKLRTG